MITSTDRSIASFMVRFTQELWRDAQGEPHVQWRGQIRHVQGDEEASFTNLADALAFMQHHLAQLTSNSVHGGNTVEQQKVLRESFKLWEQFASTYSDMMLEAMERTLKQSQALKQQMDEAIEKSLKAWQLPTQAGQTQIVAALTDLQAQVQALAEKIDRLEQAIKKSKKNDEQ